MALMNDDQPTPSRVLTDEPTTGRRLTGWTAVIAAALAWCTLAALELAAGFDLATYFEPAQALALSSSSVRWFRLAMLTDSFGFYLSFLIIGGYLSVRLRKRGDAVLDMATLALVVYVLLGVSGAVSQFAAIQPLITAHDSADAAVRAGAENAWLALVYSTQRGLWWFEGPVMAFWAFILGSRLRKSRFGSGWLLILTGIVYAAYFLGELTGIRTVADALESVAVVLVPLWLLIFGVGLLRNTRPDNVSHSIQRPVFRWLTRRLIRPIFTDASEPADKRARLDRVSRLNARLLPFGTEVERAELGDVPIEWVRSRRNSSGGHILYFHGGGYLTGSPLTHRRLAAGLARACGAEVAVVDYRLAPEHPFPAAPQDAFTAYRNLLARGVPAASIVVAGDSAGSGLALGCAIQARDAGLPKPAGVVCLSPWSDLTLSGPSARANAATDVLLTATVLSEAARLYLAGEDNRAPLASPQFADLTGLPPILVQVTDAEILYDDALALTAAARAAGVAVELEVTPGLWHVWQTFAGQLPEADHAIARITEFIARRSTRTPLTQLSAR